MQPPRRHCIFDVQVFGRLSVANERQQRHEACALDRVRYCVLADGCTACLAAADDATVAINQLLQQFDVLIIDVHRTRTLAVNEQRIFADGFCFGFCFATCRSFFERWHCF